MAQRSKTFRDRHGRGFRSPAFRAPIPVHRSRKAHFAHLAEQFFERVKMRADGQLERVQLRIADVPQVCPGSGPELGRVYPATRAHPPTLVLYYLPISQTCEDHRELVVLLADVLAEQAAHLCGKNRDELQP